MHQYTAKHTQQSLCINHVLLFVHSDLIPVEQINTHAYMYVPHTGSNIMPEHKVLIYYDILLSCHCS